MELGGFDWREVSDVLRGWHGLDTTPELHRSLRICQDELLRCDADRRERNKQKRESEQKRKTRGRRRGR